ncbi:MAG: Helicase associated domain protein [Magnetococcales bacterium]|nr:Helicase associated domain protein [Magnetococcales bacterium]
MYSPRRDKIRLLDEELFHNLTSFSELEARIFSLEDPERRKSAFAIFAEGYLALRSMPRSAEILPTHRLHENHYHNLSIPKTLTGVDGLLFMAESGCHPYHLLLHDPQSEVSAETMAPFARLLEQSHWPLLFTNLRQLPMHWLERDGFQHITGNQLDGLTIPWFSYFLRWLQSGMPSRRPTLPSEPMSEMMQRVRAIVPGVATVTLPDGPIQDEWLFHLAVSPGPKRMTLILTPGAGRILDLLHHWRRLTPPVPLSCLWVISGKEWDKSENLLPGEMDFLRVQDVAGIRHFLTSRDGNPRILWATFAAIPMLKKAQLGLSPFELTVVLDSHVLAQQSKLYETLLAQEFPASRLRLHVTSLPRCTTPFKKNRQEQPVTLFAMEDDQRFGIPVRFSIAPKHRESFAGRDWKLVVVPVQSDMLHHPETCVVHALSRSLTIHPNIHHVHIPLEWNVSDTVSVSGLGEFVTRTSNTAWDVLTWSKEVRHFSRLDRALLRIASIPGPVRHLATCDLALLSFDPGQVTASIYERLSAIMRPHAEARTGIAASLVVIDHMFEGAESSMRPDLAALCLVVQALRDMDPEFDQAFFEARRHRGRTGSFNLEPLRRWMHVADSGTNDGANTLLEWLLTTLTSPWDQYLGEFMRFHEQWGSAEVAEAGDDHSQLAAWVEVQRRARVKGWLTREHITQLDALGFVWDPKKLAWERMLAALKIFQARHRHCNVPDPYPEVDALPLWVKQQRRDLLQGRLLPAQKEQLDALGFIWDLEAWEWEQCYSRLLRMKPVTNPARITVPCHQDPELGEWADRQRLLWQKERLDENRRQRLEAVGFIWDLEATEWQEQFQRFRMIVVTLGRWPGIDHPILDELRPWLEEQRQLRVKNRLHPARCNQLNALGFIWSTRQEQWQRLFDRFVSFKRLHGHGLVPERYSADPELSSWVQDQRRDYRRGIMVEEIHSRLAMVGFVFDPQAYHWDRMLALFERYQRHHGDDDPVAVNPLYAPLKDWMASQRRMQMSGRLPETERDKLTRLGFVWDPAAKHEQTMLNALRRFMEQYGHCNIPADYNHPPTLSSWVRKLRTRRITGGLSQELIDHLDLMGFIWDAREAEWQEMFHALKQFNQERHHCIVPDPYPVHPRLPAWVKNIRKIYKNNALDKEKTESLNQLEFVWDEKAVFWEEMFVALAAYHDRFGHSLVPENDSQHARLAWWVAAQRKARAGGQLDEKQIQRLDRLHFVWDIHSAQWLEMYRELFFFHQRHGHCLIKNDSPHHTRLNDWCAIQRKARMMGNLSEEKQARLNTLGFIWDAKEMVAAEMLMYLEQYKERFGHCNVPAQWPENPQLGLWLQFQRQSYQKGQLDPERQSKLEEMGILWDEGDKR